MTGVSGTEAASRTTADRPVWRLLLAQIARATRRADAEDLLQEAYAQLLGRKTAPDNVAAFLVHVAVNKGRDAWRRDVVRGIDNNATALDGLVDGSPLQDEVLIMRQRLHQVRKVIDRMTPRTREIFLMQRLDGYSYRQIAERLAISQSGVEKHIAKAMRQLADVSYAVRPNLTLVVQGVSLAGGRQWQ